MKLICYSLGLFLKLLNFRNEDYSYVNILKMTNGPTNDLRRVLLNICQKQDLRVKTYIGSVVEDRWNFDAAVNIFIGLFRSKKVVDCFLDRDKL